MAELFGFEIKRKNQQEIDNTPSFAPKIDEEGGIAVSGAGAYGTYVDMAGAIRNEAELVTKYREMALHPEVDSAIDDVVNETIVLDTDNDIVNINLDNVEYSDTIKKVITDEFNNTLDLLGWSYQAYDVFRRWYIDGRLYYHAIINVEKPDEGIQELRYIDPRKIRKVKEVKKKKDQRSGIVTENGGPEYYIYNDKGFHNNKAGVTNGYSPTSGVKVAKDSIVHCTSGVMDVNSSMVLSYLHKAIKPLNQLRTLEDATVIYRISRAPERRIFYIDVGNLPKMKAEQYMRDIMTKFKNKLVYDSTTGEIRDDRKFMTMLEDFWLPRRDGGKGTEITTLPPGQNLGELDDVLYFQKKLYKSLNVPISRLESETGFNLGRATEISRDEVKFAKFIDRLRTRFSQLFIKVLEKQLILKGIMTTEEWKEISNDIKFDFARDNFFAELRDSEILQQRLQSLSNIENYVGKYYSNEYVRKNILMQTDEEIKEIDAQIEAEKADEDTSDDDVNSMIDGDGDDQNNSQSNDG